MVTAVRMNEVRLVRWYDYKDMINYEEKDEDTADEMSQEVDLRDKVTHIENSDE